MPKPKLPPGKAKTVKFFVRMSKEEKKRIERYANKNGFYSLSEYVRMCIKFYEDDEFIKIFNQ